MSRVTLLFKPVIFLFERLSLLQKLMFIFSLSTLPLALLLLYCASLLQGVSETLPLDLTLFVAVTLVISLYLIVGYYCYQQQLILRLKSGDNFCYKENEFDPVFTVFHQQQVTIERLKERSKSASDELHSAALDLAAMNKRSTEMMTVQQVSVASIQSEMEQLSHNIDVVSRHAEDATNTSKMADKHASEGDRVVETMAAEIQTASDSISHSADQINGLLTSSNEIGSIIKTIDEIANQTNLLALNAAIEAARAGEHGRGFSVVSNEVRQLAQRSQEAAFQVNQQISTIQSDVQSVSNGMEQIIRAINSSVKLSSETHHALQSIKKGAQSTVDAMSNISLAIREQGEGSTEVSLNIEKINQMAQQTTEVIQEASETAHYLVNLSHSQDDQSC